MAEKLNLMDSFPTLELQIAGGGRLRVPDEIETPYAAVIFYRGYW